MAPRSRSSVSINGGQFRSIEGLKRITDSWAAIPESARRKIKPALDKGAEELVAKIKQIAPDDPETPGSSLAANTHTAAGDIELGVKIVEDAVDREGAPFPAHVEYGHKDSSGHVAAKPHFWPAYRVLKKRIQSRVTRAMSAAAKEAVGGQ